MFYLVAQYLVERNHSKHVNKLFEQFHSVKETRDISGQIGWDEAVTFQTDDFAEKAGQALRNIMSILAEANANAEHITRMTWYITNKQEYLASLKLLGQKI